MVVFICRVVLALITAGRGGLENLLLVRRRRVMMCSFSRILSLWGRITIVRVIFMMRVLMVVSVEPSHPVECEGDACSTPLGAAERCDAGERILPRYRQREQQHGQPKTKAKTKKPKARSLRRRRSGKAEEEGREGKRKGRKSEAKAHGVGRGPGSVRGERLTKVRGARCCGVVCWCVLLLGFWLFVGCGGW